MLELLRDEGPLTDGWIVERYGELVEQGAAKPASDSLICQQRRSLVTRGLVEPSGVNAVNPTGYWATEWRAVPTDGDQ